MTPIRLFLIYRSIQENGSLDSPHPASAVINLLSELQKRPTETERLSLIATLQYYAEELFGDSNIFLNSE